MILDQDRVDNWLTKGLGGAIDMVEQRSRSNRFINRCHYDELKETADLLELLAQEPIRRGSENFDHTVSLAAHLLVQVFMIRAKRSGLRGIDPVLQDNIGGYARRLRESLARLDPTD